MASGTNKNVHYLSLFSGESSDRDRLLSSWYKCFLVLKIADNGLRPVLSLRGPKADDDDVGDDDSLPNVDVRNNLDTVLVFFSLPPDVGATL